MVLILYLSHIGKCYWTSLLLPTECFVGKNDVNLQKRFSNNDLNIILYILIFKYKYTNVYYRATIKESRVKSEDKLHGKFIN